MWKKEQRIAWIRRSVSNSLLVEAERVSPYETGGCLIGYWVVPFKEVVVTQAIGPGPNAVHKKYEFKPDHEWQESEIARIYQESGRLHTYLGDWHTHPNTSNTRLSCRDLQTLNRIAKCESARAQVPLMAILAGSYSWTAKIWSYQLISLGNIQLSSRTGGFKIRIYD